MKLIDEWRHWWKLWSVRLSAIALVLQSLLLALPDAAVQAWTALPADLKAMLPPQLVSWLPVALIAAGIVARLIRQERLDG